MDRARPERALLRGELRADGLDLLAALVADPACRAVEVLERAGVTVEPAPRARGGPNRREACRVRVIMNTRVATGVTGVTLLTPLP